MITYMYMRCLLCEGVMVCVPLDLSHRELSNEYQYAMRGLLCEGVMIDVVTIGFVSLRAFK